MDGESRRDILALVVVLILALALRLFRLDVKPLWWDEGNSIYFANLLTPSKVLAETIATHDTNPPVHRIALGLWSRTVGFSPFAVRAFSALLGVLSVWAIWIWGRWLGGYEVGIIAATLTAISPAIVQHSRETKGYLMLMFLVLLQSYVWAKWLGYLKALPSSPLPHSSAIRMHRFLWAAVYVVLTVLALGTHYYAILLIAVQNLWVLVDIGSRIPRLGFKPMVRELGQWFALQVVSALLLLPWVLAVWQSTLEGARSASLRKHPLGWCSYWRIVLTYLGSRWGVSEGIVAMTTAILLACIVIGFRVFNRRSAAMLTYWAISPLLFAYPLQRIYPFFYPRFFLYVLPAWYLLAAAGIWAIVHSIPGKAAALGLMVCLAYSLLGLYNPAADVSEDYRPLMADLCRLAAPGDAVLLIYPWQIGYLKSYAPQLYETVSLYRSCCPSTTMPGSLQAILARHPRIWLITYRVANDDPHEIVGTWLNDHAFRTLNSWYGKSQLALFIRSRTAEEKWHADWKGLGDCAIFLGYDLESETIEAGSKLHLTLYWRAQRPMETSYTVFTHLIDSQGRIWGQWDNPPMKGGYPTTNWTEGEFIPDKYEIPVSPDAPAGEYQLEVGMYDPITGERLPALGRDGKRLPNDRVLLETTITVK